MFFRGGPADGKVMRVAHYGDYINVPFMPKKVAVFGEFDASDYDFQQVRYRPHNTIPWMYVPEGEENK